MERDRSWFDKLTTNGIRPVRPSPVEGRLGRSELFRTLYDFSVAEFIQIRAEGLPANALAIYASATPPILVSLAIKTEGDLHISSFAISLPDNNRDNLLWSISGRPNIHNQGLTLSPFQGKKR